MSIIRVQKNSNYSVISNVHINDERLSWKATAILTYLLSKPNDWTVYVKQLAGAKKDGIKAVYSGIKELKEYGYIEHRFIREEGKIQHGEYIVHEEPMIVEKPVNPESEPYTQKGDTVKVNTENGTLLNTEVKINTDDDKQPAPESANPGPQEQNPPEPSSSFSESELISIIAGLITLVPEAFQKPSVEKTIEKALIVHSVAYLKSAIAYTNDHSNGNSWQKYRAYLDKTINHGYADGYQGEQGKQVDTGPALDFTKIPDDNLRFMADGGNVHALAELKHRKESGSKGRLS